MTKSLHNYYVRISFRKNHLYHSHTHTYTQSCPIILHILTEIKAGDSLSLAIDENNINTFLIMCRNNKIAKMILLINL